MRHCLLLLAMLCVAGCTRTSSQGFVNLGHVGTFSGGDAYADDQASRGLRLALTEKDLAQVDGKPIQIRHTDTRGTVEAFESQAVRLASLSKVAAIYGGDSSQEVASLNRSHALILSPLGFRPAGVNDAVFLVGLNASLQGSTLAQFVVDRLAKISFLSVTPDPLVPLITEPVRPTVMLLKELQTEGAENAAQGFVNGWSESWSKHGEAATAPRVVPFGNDVSWKELAATVAEARPTCLVFVGAASGFRSLLQHMPEVPFLVFAGRDGTLRDLPNERTVYQATAFAVDPALPSTGEFAKRFREAYKIEPDVNAAIAYESMRILSVALKKSIASGNSLAYELRALKEVQGLAGKLSFGAAGQVLQRPVLVIRQEGSTVTVCWRRDPS